MSNIVCNSLAFSELPERFEQFFIFSTSKKKRSTQFIFYNKKILFLQILDNSETYTAKLDSRVKSPDEVQISFW